MNWKNYNAERFVVMKDLTERKLVYLDDAIDAIVGCTNCGTEEELRAYVTRHSLEDVWSGGIVDAIDAVEQLPSAQPERPTGEWLRMSDLSEKDDNRYKCSRCENVIHHKSRMDLYTFNSWCGRCGSDNSRHTT